MNRFNLFHHIVFCNYFKRILLIHLISFLNGSSSFFLFDIELTIAILSCSIMMYKSIAIQLVESGKSNLFCRKFPDPLEQMVF